MPADPVLTKTDMYARRSRGEFGNITPEWFDWVKWCDDIDALSPADPLARCRWGVRCMTPGGPCRMHVSRGLVPMVSHDLELCGERFNISPMLDDLGTVTAMIQVWDGPAGLVAQAAERPAPGVSWRVLMPPAPEYTGTAARLLLRKHLNPNSRDDLAVLLEQYPDHVIEMSTLDRCLGTVPGRNAILWEVRNY